VALVHEAPSRTDLLRPACFVRGIGWGCCGYYLALALLSFFFIRPTLSDVLWLLVFLTYPLAGALIIGRYPAHPVGWLFSALGGFFATVSFAEVYVTAAAGASPETLPGWVAIAWLWNVLTAGAPFLFGIFLPLIFPTGYLPSPRWRPLAWVAAVGATGITLWAAFSPGTMRVAPAVENPLALSGALGQIFAALGFAILLAPVCDAIAVASLFFRLRRARGDERQQLKWMLSAATIVALGFAGTLGLKLFGIYGEIDTTPVILSYIAIPVAASVAIFRYRLYDIDLIINRTLVYAALTACVVALYSLVVTGIGALFQTSGSLGISLFATGLIAVLFQPLRARLQHGVSRILFGDRDEPYAVLTLLSRRLAGTLDPETVLPTIVQTVTEALKLPYAAIVLQQEGAPSVVAAVGEPVPESLRLPLVYQQEVIGEFLLGARTPDDAFSPADRHLLDDLAGQVGLAAHAVRLNTALQRSRARLVTARKEDRRRLRRDLHDGLGPALSSILLKVAVTRRQLPPESPADAMLRLEVCDNGAGLPARPRSGIGLTSMRERAAELGGACAIESLASGGTCVSACLPIAGEGSR